MSFAQQTGAVFSASRGVGGIPLPVARPSTSFFGGLSGVTKGLNAVTSIAGVLGGQKQSQAGLRAQSAAAAQTQQNVAAVNDFNAAVASQNAELARQTAATEATELRAEAKKRTSSIRARLAAGGVVTTAGSPLLVQAAQQAEGGKAAQRRLNRGEREARGFETQASLDTFRADIARGNAATGAQAGKIARSTELLQGIGEITTVGTSLL